MQCDRIRTKRLSLDGDGFEAKKRLAMYEIVNTLVMVSLDVQRTLGLKPDACQLLMVIAISTVQRYARNPEDTQYLGTEPLPTEMSGSISRRQLAECTGIPRETVARHVRHLIEAGHVIEARRGQLRTPPGLLNRLGVVGLPNRMAQDMARMSNALLRMGALQIK